MTREYWSQLNGEIPSSQQGNSVSYYTNYGSIEIDIFSKDVVNSCIGFTDYSIENGDKHVSIRVKGDEISIRTGTIYKDNSEFSTPGYPYKLQHYPRPDMGKVFEILYNSAPMTQGIIAVILKVNRIIGNKLNNSERKYLDHLIKMINFRYFNKILRKPIIQRTPIKVDRTPINTSLDIKDKR